MRNRQEGIVSIVVTMIIMFILSILVLGFARVTRREQRQSLDRQLASQAQYAAESGINDVQAVLESTPGYAFGSGCATMPAGIDNVINAAANTSYSCVLVDKTPASLVRTNLGTDDGSWTVPLRAATGSFDSLTINWHAPNDQTYSLTDCPAVPTIRLPQAGSSWTCESAAILRIDLVPLGASVSRSSLLAGTRTFLLYPTASGGVGSGSYGGVSRGRVYVTQCVTGAGCSFTLGPDIPAQANGYYMRVKPLYAATNVTITGTSAGTPVRFTGAQAIVDATGRANDVLKRLQARVPLGSQSGSMLDYALQSIDSICKLYNVTPPSTVQLDPSGDSDSACALP